MPGAAITNASVQFKAYKNDSNTDNLTLQGEAADNPVTFTDNDYDISSRPRTVASVPWSPAAWTTNNNYQTPDLTGIVQELVNRPGWASGNALVMLVSAPGPSYGNRAAISYNYQPANAAKLSVSYNQVVTTKYYSFNGQKVALRKNGVIYYLHTDHLGGTALVTKADGTVESEQGYYAYGRHRTGGTLPTDHKFTGQKLDGSGLYYYNARYYDPELGIFVSPDTIVPDAEALIDYNRYAYARANPVKYSDPSGHCVFGGLDTLFCAFVAVTGIGYGTGRVTYEYGMHQSPEGQQFRRDQVGGALVTDLSDVISQQAQAHSIDATLISAVIRLESSAVERRTLTFLPSSAPGVIADSAEYVQSLLQGDFASIGIGQMQLRRARELEELGYVTPAASDHDRRAALLDNQRAVGYVAGMLHYLSDQLQTLPGYSNLSQDDQARLVLIGYNQGWEYLQYNFNEMGPEDLISTVGYDNLTLDEYLQ